MPAHIRTHRARPRRWTIGTALSAAGYLGVLTAIPGGCGGDDCVPGESRCDGDAILGCGTPGDITGDRGFTALGRGCGSDRCLDLVDGGKRVAVCSTTGVKDARCKDGVAGATCIDDKTFMVCRLGYASRETTCGACIASPGSPSASPTTICALDAAESQACGGASGEVCDGDAVVQCLRGWITSRRACGGAAPTCVAAGQAAYCASGGACAGANETRCDGASVKGCAGGRVIDEACGDGNECRAYFGYGRCATKCKVVRDHVCVDPTG